VQHQPAERPRAMTSHVSGGHLQVSPGVDFTNILRAAFTLSDPKSTKKTDGLTVFFALFGFSRIKAVCKMLVKLTIIKILQVAFSLWIKC